MEIEILRGFLRGKEFSIYKELYQSNLFKRFSELGMDIWADNNRIIVTKQYVSESQLSSWNEEDQLIMLMLLKDIPVRYKNNLYLFMVLDLGDNYSNKLPLKINRIEKNAEVCKKYVIKNESDLYRIPFLNRDTIEEGDLFNYEQSFKEELNNINDISVEVRQAINSYFNVNEGTWKDNVESVWKEGIEFENK